MTIPFCLLEQLVSCAIERLPHCASFPTVMPCKTVFPTYHASTVVAEEWIGDRYLSDPRFRFKDCQDNTRWVLTKRLSEKCRLFTINVPDQLVPRMLKVSTVVYECRQIQGPAPGTVGICKTHVQYVPLAPPLFPVSPPP